MMQIVKDESSLSSMLETIATKLKNGEDLVLPKSFTQDLRIQDAKMQLAVRIIAFSKIKKSLQTSQQIEKVQQALDQRLSSEDLAKYTHGQLMELQRKLESDLKSDLQFLREVSGFTGEDQDQALISQLVETIANMSKQTAVAAAQASGDIPQDPQKREQLRKLVLSFPGAQEKTA